MFKERKLSIVFKVSFLSQEPSSISDYDTEATVTLGVVVNQSAVHKSR